MQQIPRVTAILCAVLLVAGESRGQDAADGQVSPPARPTAVVIMNCLEIRLAGTASPTEIELAAEGLAEPVRFTVPKAEGRITEIKACPVVKTTFHMLAFAIEVTSNDGSERSYYLALASVDYKGKTISVIRAESLRPAIEKFLSVKEDYDIAGMSNSGGDSVYVVLSRHTRLPPAAQVTGYVYVHDCPVVLGSGITGPGKLYEMHTDESR